MGEVAFAKQFLTALESRPARLSSDHVVDPKTYPAQPAFILPRMPQPKRKPASSAPSETTPDAAPPASSSSPSSTPQQQPCATVTLKPTRPTPATPAYTHAAPLPLATTSMHDLKALYARAHPGVSTDKIKVLWARKPVGDTKTLRDVLGDSAPSSSSSSASQAIEFSVMILGGGGGGGAGTPTAGTPAVSTPERVASPPVAVPSPAPPAAAPTQTEVEMGEAPVPEAPGEAAEVLRTDAFWTDLQGFLVQRLRDEGEGERLAGVFREAWQKEGSTS